MANSIPLQVAPRDVREELRTRLERAPGEHAEAILAAFDLLQEMHNQGILDMARGVVGARDEILGTLATDAGTPEALRTIRNLLFLRRVLGAIEPDCFEAIFQAIPEGIAQAAAQRHQPVTLIGLLRRLIQKDTLRAVAAAIDFLQCFGRRLRASDDSRRRNTTGL